MPLDIRIFVRYNGQRPCIKESAAEPAASYGWFLPALCCEKEGVYFEADAARQYSITKCKISAASYRRRGLFASMTRLHPLVKILREFLLRAAKERKP